MPQTLPRISAGSLSVRQGSDSFERPWPLFPNPSPGEPLPPVGKHPIYRSTGGLSKGKTPRSQKFFPILDLLFPAPIPSPPRRRFASGHFARGKRNILSADSAAASHRNQIFLISPRPRPPFRAERACYPPGIREARSRSVAIPTASIEDDWVPRRRSSTGRWTLPPQPFAAGRARVRSTWNRSCGLSARTTPLSRTRSMLRV